MPLREDDPGAGDACMSLEDEWELVTRSKRQGKSVWAKGAE